MPSTSWGYRAAVRIGAALAPVLGLVDRKVGDGHRQRRGAAARLSAWAAGASRPPRGRSRGSTRLASARGCRPRACCSSSGASCRGCQLVYTHFSPSAEPLARRLTVDAADYLPYDLPEAADQLLAALAPDLLVFSKLDLWPELATRADVDRHHRGARGGHGERRAAAGSAGPRVRLLRAGYAAVSAAGDHRRGGRRTARAPRRAAGADPRPRRSAVRQRGRPRGRGAARRAAAPVRTRRADLVAGSTWPADEAVLLAAFARVRARRPEARLDPRAARADGRSPRRRSTAARRRPDSPRPRASARPKARRRCWWWTGSACSRRSTGPGTMAYVGGGFGRAGLHSVLEPAAWGVPVAFGPSWRDSRDAELLLRGRRRRGARAWDRDQGGTARYWPSWWERWMTDESHRAAQGGRARAIVAEGLGAARRSAEMLAELISSRPPRTVTVRGTRRPAVSTVNSTSLQRLRTRIFTSATPLPPTSCAASAFRSDGSLSVAMPQSPNRALLETLKRSPAGGGPAGDASVAGTPSVVASNVWAQPPRRQTSGRARAAPRAAHSPGTRKA